MPEKEKIIEVRGLTKKYGELTAVDSISFSVEKGKIFAFLGPNGAGKSTTIKTLTTVLRPTKGEIRINGFDPEKEQDEVRRSFGIVFQDPSLDDKLTVYENMEFHGVLYGVPRELREKRIKSLLELVDLWERRDSLVETLSGGMRRRLEIARGLLHHPKIFFLDEPTLGLDPQTRKSIWEHIKKLNKKEGITIFFTTHYMEEAELYADEVAVIDRGKIIERGTVKEIKKKTKTKKLEDAFIELTGKTIREAEAGSKERMRRMHKVRRR